MPVIQVPEFGKVRFPDDMSEGQIVSAIKKMRLDRQIELDKELYSPLKGMNAVEKFIAGSGSGLMDVLRGVGQAAGMTSREDVSEARRLDAPLKDTSAGKWGNVAGQVAAYLPTAMIPGANTLAGAAAIGLGTGALAPSESTEETIKNTLIGGAAGPAAVMVGRGIGAGYQGIRGLLDPLTEKGQERIAASTLRRFAQDPGKAAAALKKAQPLVPGSAPTMAQGSGDPGLAQLERTLVNNPETGPLLASRFADQRAARQAAIQNVAGSDEHYNAIKAGRSLFANEDYARAAAEGIDPEMAKALKPQIQSLMSRPSIQQAKRSAIRLAKEQDIALNDFGSIEGLDWLKKGLDDVISRGSNPVNPIGKAELKALVQTKQDLMSVIEQVSPAYKLANDNFAKMSGQVNSMDVGRELLKRYEPALARYGANTRELGGSYATALEGAKESVKRSTGMDLPLSRVMGTGDISMLENVAKDLARKAKADDLGRAVGSNTAQNLSAQNLLRRALGPTGLPQSWSESTALQTLLSPVSAAYRVGGAEKKIMDRLASAALEPQEAAALLALEKKSPGLIRKLLESKGGELQPSVYLPGQAAGLLTTR
jgi:hypothetical protein